MRIVSTLMMAGITLACGSGIAHAHEIRYQDVYTSNGQAIATDYGSIAGVVDVLNTTPSGLNLLYWTGAYSGQPAAYSGDSSIGLITLTPAAGLVVTLDSFFLGAWPDSNRNISYSIDDLATPGLDIEVTSALVSGQTGLLVSPALSSAVGLRISFGPDGFNGGINNIVFSVSAVPEPESYALLLAGLGLIGFAARRRATRR
jgi:hypothetical protein